MTNHNRVIGDGDAMNLIAVLLHEFVHTPTFPEGGPVHPQIAQLLIEITDVIVLTGRAYVEVQD